jgi:translation initiation factor IF-3
VCRVLDYSKYKYEQAQKLKQARKHQQQITIREIKFRPKIAEHDYDTKKHHVERFLRHKDKVKVTIMFRGREVTHPERGTAILDRLAEELSELGVVEQRPMQEGRNMTMMMAPSKAVLAGRLGEEDAVGAETAGEPAHDGDVASAALESTASAADAPAVEQPPREESAGDDSAAGDSAAGESASEDSAAEDSAAEDSASADSVPEGSAPAGSAAEESAPEDSAAGAPAPEASSAKGPSRAPRAPAHEGPSAPAESAA